MGSGRGHNAPASTASARNIAPLIILPALLLRGVWQIDRPARVPPSAKAAADMSDRFQSHPLRCLGGERRARTCSAEEHEFLVRREGQLVIFAGRVEPEFQHAARAMKCVGNAPLAVE